MASQRVQPTDVRAQRCSATLEGASSAASLDAAGKVDGSCSSPKAYMFTSYYFTLNFICGCESVCFETGCRNSCIMKHILVCPN